ncbi:MAG: molybdopterin-dependent oxidoreductase [Thermodesulfovibrionales bacterium]|nr:molybdopterin-dependent oxidoreductase [Thermodesulfovibrionales bacterium]
MKTDKLSRRSFIKKAGQLGAALALGKEILADNPLAQAQEKAVEKPVFAGKEKMMVLSSKPIVLEMPLDGFEHFITPTEMFFVRNNIGQPAIDIQKWSLTIDGEVKSPLRLTMNELKRFEGVEAIVTLECYGNSRGFFDPKASGNQWKHGGIGTAKWKGVRLKDVLEKANITDRAKHIIFDGADEPFVPTAPDFKRSIPVEKAMSPETLLVYEMNGAPLPVYHGYPLRVLVPGWGGSCSVKWLISIDVSEKQFDGVYMADKYRTPINPVKPGTKVSPKNMRVLTDIDVKSIIFSPSDGARVSTGEALIRGYAWTGDAEIVRVDVSTDSGRTWQKAKIVKNGERYVWSLWEYRWKAQKPGSYLLMCRATDSKGRLQPISADWNQDGYLFNAMDKVRIEAE